MNNDLQSLKISIDFIHSDCLRGNSYGRKDNA